MINVGDKAPSFTLPDQNDQPVSLDSFKGKWVVLYFYPKDDTPGCTTEAQQFRDEFLRFTVNKAEILGVSKDSVASHTKFRAKHNLPFPLVSDPEGSLCQMFDVWKEKNLYGKKSMGIERSTFLIDEEGVLRAVWRKVKVANHVHEVLQALHDL